MNVLRLLTLFAMSAVLAACATVTNPDVGPEFEEGRKMGVQYARNDGPTLVCKPGMTELAARSKARTYTSQLQSQGHSDQFIKGFHMGYERTYFTSFINVYCTR